MKKNKISILLLALTVFLSIVSCKKEESQTPAPAPKPAPKKTTFTKRDVSLGTHKLAAFSIINNSKYLVVFESGLGDDHTIWDENNVGTSIGAKMDVVTYDRAARGLSQSGPVPRDINRLQSELTGIIDAYANDRKIVLIGHSLGGFIVRDWAIKNPARVAGLLLVDPSHETAFDMKMAQTAEDYMYTDWNKRYGPAFGATLEAREWVEDLEYMAKLDKLPDVPVIVLTAMKVEPPATAEDLKPWYSAHESLKNGVTDFTHISMPNAGHMIMRDDPQALIRYINMLLSKLK